jgi:hypothetical protein
VLGRDRTSDEQRNPKPGLPDPARLLSLLRSSNSSQWRQAFTPGPPSDSKPRIDPLSNDLDQFKAENPEIRALFKATSGSATKIGR